MVTGFKVVHEFEDGQLILGDCLDWLKYQEDDSVDLIFGSPPYEDARTYRIDFNLKGQDWVDWMVERWVEMNRVCRGLVAMVVEGRTDDFQWSATPALLMADLHRKGIRLRNPPIFERVGISGSGGPDWLRNDYEHIICSTKGRLPWSDNTAMGHPPKWAPGGKPSHRTKSGRRVHKLHTKNDGKGMKEQGYNPPDRVNPGNVIKCIVGGGVMGSKLAHENEAPFPEKLAEFFILSFCPEGGIVVDPFTGSGTTISMARKYGRSFIGIDIRDSQIKLSNNRLEEARRLVGFGV